MQYISNNFVLSPHDHRHTLKKKEGLEEDLGSGWKDKSEVTTTGCVAPSTMLNRLLCDPARPVTMQHCTIFIWENSRVTPVPPNLVIPVHHYSGITCDALLSNSAHAHYISNLPPPSWTGGSAMNPHDWLVQCRCAVQIALLSNQLIRTSNMITILNT